MYPADMQLPNGAGFARANTEAEYRALRAAGYEGLAAAGDLPAVPPPVAPVVDQAPAAAPSTAEEARAELDRRGIEYDKRWGLAKLLAALK